MRLTLVLFFVIVAVSAALADKSKESKDEPVDEKKLIPKVEEAIRKVAQSNGKIPSKRLLVESNDSKDSSESKGAEDVKDNKVGPKEPANGKDDEDDGGDGEDVDEETTTVVAEENTETTTEEEDETTLEVDETTTKKEKNEEKTSPAPTSIFTTYISNTTPRSLENITVASKSGPKHSKCVECPADSSPEFSQKVYVATYLCGEHHTLALQTPILIRDDHECVHVYGDIPRYFDVSKAVNRVYVNIRQNLDATLIQEPSIVLNLNVTCPGLQHEESATLIINFDDRCFDLH